MNLFTVKKVTIGFVLGVLLLCPQYIFSQSYEMADKRLTFGTGVMLNPNVLGAMPQVHMKGSWRNNNGDESALSFYYWLPSTFSDTFTVFAKQPGIHPSDMHLKATYSYRQYSMMYHYNYYFLGTEYDNDYGFYLSGAFGLSIKSVSFQELFDQNRYDSPKYNYRAKSGYSFIGQIAFGAHYQFYDQLRVVGECGPYFFLDRDIRARKEGDGYRTGLNISVGLVYGIRQQ